MSSTVLPLRQVPLLLERALEIEFLGTSAWRPDVFLSSKLMASMMTEVKSASEKDRVSLKEFACHAGLSIDIHSFISLMKPSNACEQIYVCG
jgi:hypothetical protein